MADEISLTSKPQKPAHEEFSSSSQNQSKSFSQFLYKSAIVTVFLVLLPFFPSLAPEFINQTLHARSWELIQLIFVGIAVSYGLFSKKNDEREKLDNAQSYVSRILQVSSVFDDEPENPSSSTVIEENTIRTSNSKYYRGEPLVLVAEKTPLDGNDDNGSNVITSEINRKPLLLPVRSLKQRVPEREEVDLVDGLGGENGSISKSGSKRFTSNSRKSKIGGGLDVRKTEEDVEENLVLRSPIPWQSRSGRMEFRENGGSPNLDEQDFKKFESFRTNNSSSKNLSPSKSFSSEYFPAKNSGPPPPPPPPPPPSASLRKSVLMKSNSVSAKNEASSDKVLRRSVRSVPPSAEELSSDGLAKSVRTLRFNSELERNSVDYEPKYVEKMVNGKVPNESTQTNVKFLKKETNEKAVMETSDEDSEVESEDDYFDQGSLGNKNNKNNSLKNDVGPDVDKKADEFIAKFREQIRLQRIESIRRSTEQRAGKTFR